VIVADFWNDGILTNGCMAGGHEYFHVISTGDVEPCVFCHFAADNVKEKSLKEVLDSPFFKAFRTRRPYNDNLLRPCTIIDNPNILREVVAEGGAHPTHVGSESVITTLAPALDKYAKEYGEVADKAWREEYENKIYKPHLSVLSHLINGKRNGKMKRKERKKQAMAV
jgi:hypothetical protein